MVVDTAHVEPIIDEDLQRDFFTACCDADLLEIERLASNDKVDIDKRKVKSMGGRTCADRTALTQAVCDKKFNVVKTLLHVGANCNKTDFWGQTPLYWASGTGDLETVISLVEHGADVNIQRKDGWAALHEAAFYNHVEICRFLLASGADPLLKSESGDSAHQVALLNNCHECASALNISKPQRSRMRWQRLLQIVGPNYSKLLPAK